MRNNWIKFWHTSGGYFLTVFYWMISHWYFAFFLLWHPLLTALELWCRTCTFLFQSRLAFPVIYTCKHPALIALQCTADKRWQQPLLFPLHTWHHKVVNQSLVPVLQVHWIWGQWTMQQCIILIGFQGSPFPVLWALTPAKHHLGMCFEVDGSQVLA